jgi:orotidine-5'-phosphate decarboxylase
MNFIDKLLNSARSNNSLLCIGLDPDPELMPHGVNVLDFNQAIIEATYDLVCAYKPNLAFYEAMGVEGLRALAATVACIPDTVPVIGDAKRGDIGNTAKAYAKALFEGYGFDAVTVNPYLGGDSLQPFIEYEDKGIFILCRTSNPGSADLQDLSVDGTPLFEVVAKKALEWDEYGNIGLVVGATYPDDIKRVRKICPDMPILIPGVGKQGGDLSAAVRNGVDSNKEKAIINSSRGIIFASKGKNFAEAARKAAIKTRDEINLYLKGD